MPEVHGKGLGGTSIRDTYQQEIATSQQQAAAATKVAQQMVAEKVTRESKAKSDIYGEVLGNMYDGDRDAIMQFRDHIRQEFLDGTYSSDPSMYQTRIANLNAMIENAENFYKTTYGDDSADGTGNTYRDIQIRNERGNSVEFWEEKGLEMKGDEWMEAQQRLQELQGGMYRDLQFTPDGNVMARAINPETGELGELTGFENLPQREIGSQNFLPETRIISPQSVMDLAGESQVQQRLYQLQRGLLTEAGTVTLEGRQVNVTDMDELQKMNYLSDMYFDDNVTKGLNNSEARRFRRSVAKEVVPPLSSEETDAFVSGDLKTLQNLMGHQEGDTESRYIAMMNEARAHWREVTRQSFLKQPEQLVKDGSGDGKTPETGYVKDGFVFTTAHPDPNTGGTTSEIRGDRLDEPMIVRSSQVMRETGINTERDEYRIVGATIDPVNGDYIVRIEIPVFEESVDPFTGKRTTTETYEPRDIITHRNASGLAKEVFGNIMNSPLANRLSAKRSIYLDRERSRNNL